MSRVIANLILIIIIAFTVSAVPINTELLNMNITFPESPEKEADVITQPEVVETETPLLLVYQEQKTDYLYNPLNIELKFIGDRSIDQTAVDAFIDELQLEIYQNTTFDQEQIVKRFDKSDLLDHITNTINGDVLTISLDTSRSGLNLSKGHYNIKVLSNSKLLSTKLDLSYALSYTDTIEYKSPASAARGGYKYLTLYFMDEDKNYLVPVSREVKQSGNLIRTTLNALKDGPLENSGLNMKSPAPYIPAARFSTTTEMVKLETNSWENSEFTQTEDDTYMMMHSLINTMTSIENVSSVKFSVNKKDNAPLNGFDLSKSYPQPDTPTVYLGLATATDRMYLIPAEVEATTAKETLQFLKYGIVTEPNLYAPVPSNIDIVSESLTDGILTVNFSGNIQTAYPQNPAYAILMMDSLSHSFMSLSGVEALLYRTDSNDVGELFGYTLEEAFVPAKYLNVE